MTDLDANAQGAADLVAALAALGPATAFISPGSRNTPVALAAALSPETRTVSIRDERSAGFAALGASKRLGTTAYVVCTSGSAGAHYLPSVIEANHSSIPVIIVTCDRPTRLHGTFAPQTTDQHGLFSTHVKESIEVDLTSGDVMATILDALALAHEGVPGPVHLNVPIDEPLTPEHLPEPSAIPEPPERPDRTPIDLGSQLKGKRTLIVSTGFHGAEAGNSLSRWARACGAALIADPQSTADNTTNGHWLAATGYLDEHPPDLLLRIGALPSSKPLQTWLESFRGDQILVSNQRQSDPYGASHLINATTEMLTTSPPVAADRSYRDLLHARGADLEATATSRLSEAPFPNEPAVAHLVSEHVPSGGTLVVASSMPIRDIEVFGRRRDDLTVLSNRGVNGIDGTLSTAIGCAIDGDPVTVLIGDIAFLHDVSAISEIARLDLPIGIVVVNNDGGGIFSFLPQHRSGVIPTTVYEEVWGTPHGADLTAIATAMGMQASVIEASEQLVDFCRAGIGPRLAELQTSRSENLALHDAITRAVLEL